MSIVLQAFHPKQKARQAGGGDVPEHSILTPNHQHGPINFKHKPNPRQMTQKPVNWREVALRRRKVADCQLIACVVTSGLLILIAGLSMFLVAWCILGKEDPFILIGPVFAGCGVIVLLLSIEICVRRQKVIKQTEDLSSDDEDGHFIDEGLINYGYGHFNKDESPAPAKSPARTVVVQPQSLDEEYKPSFEVEGRLKPEDRPRVNILAPTPEVLNTSLTQESIEMLLSPTRKE